MNKEHNYQAVDIITDGNTQAIILNLATSIGPRYIVYGGDVNKDPNVRDNGNVGPVLLPATLGSYEFYGQALSAARRFVYTPEEWQEHAQN